MKAIDRKKKRSAEEEEEHEETAHEPRRGGGDLQNKSASPDVSIAADEERSVMPVHPPSGRQRFPQDERMVEQINSALGEIRSLRRKAHFHDSEIARLEVETRQLIEEMQEELKVA